MTGDLHLTLLAALKIKFEELGVHLKPEEFNLLISLKFLIWYWDRIFKLSLIVEELKYPF